MLLTSGCLIGIKQGGCPDNFIGIRYHIFPIPLQVSLNFDCFGGFYLYRRQVQVGYTHDCGIGLLETLIHVIVVFL